MNLRTALPDAWAKQSLWLVLLLPLSWLYGLITGLIRLSYQLGLKHAYTAPVPVMIIGNITVGGSGKTPLLIELVRYLTDDHGLQVGVISRGYGGDVSTFPRMVKAKDSAAVVGDEPLLIVQQTGVAMAVCPNRQAAIECLLADAALHERTLDIILSDDGLQHLALDRQLEWIVVDRDRGLGQGWLLPAGFLRESPERLKTATVIEHSSRSVAQSSHTGDSGYEMHLVAGALQPLNHSSDHAAPNPPMRIHAVAGIGNPKRFFDSLGVMGFEVIEHAFADHHAYQAGDLDFGDGLPVITTAKDAMKLDQSLKNIWILPVQAALTPACYTLLHEQLVVLGVLPAHG